MSTWILIITLIGSGSGAGKSAAIVDIEFLSRDRCIEAGEFYKANGPQSRVKVFTTCVKKG